MKTINAKVANKFIDEAEALLEELAKKYNLSLAMRGCKYATSSISFSTTFTSKEALEIVANRTLEIGEKYKILRLGTVTLLSYNARARKYPWRVSAEDGTVYRVADIDLLPLD